MVDTMGGRKEEEEGARSPKASQFRLNIAMNGPNSAAYCQLGRRLARMGKGQSNGEESVEAFRDGQEGCAFFFESFSEFFEDDKGFGF